MNIIFLFVAQSVNIYRKGFDLLADALKNLKHLSITLLVLGDADNLHIDGVDIRRLGIIDDNEKLAYFYSNADAFIIPSREDNLPNVMLEALACGTPVIGFPIGGIKEHVNDFKTGLLAEEVSSESLGKAIEMFCKTKDRFNREQISEYAFDNFNEKIIAAKYLKIYAALISEM